MLNASRAGVAGAHAVADLDTIITHALKWEKHLAEVAAEGSTWAKRRNGNTEVN